MYVCTPCRNKGSISKRLMKLKFECERLSEQRLASERLLEERQDYVEGLLADKQVLVKENQILLQLASSKGLPPPPVDTARHVPKVEHVHSDPIDTEPVEAEGDSSTESSHEEEENRTSPPVTRQSRIGHPPGFKDIRARVGRFSGKKGEEDFDLWLSNYKEANADFEWDDDKRAKWFSWFLEGPAKATWQRMLTDEERTSWTAIARIFQGQYGVHMDPRTAYLRCHELRYEDLGSVQALLEAMREYQRMAPEKLSDTNLESILWNKVPYTVQREVGEMKDWALQELFQRLLKAEARVQERERRQQSVVTQLDRAPVTVHRGAANPVDKQTVPSQPGRNPQSFRRSTESVPGGRSPTERSTVEMTTRNVKCFNCHEKGHM